MTMQLTSMAKVFGHAPKVTTSADVTPGILAQSYEMTLYVLTFGTLASFLSYQLQDSDDGSTWANVTSIVNGVAGQSVIVNGVANSSALLAVKHSHVRRYHRLVPANGTGNNLGSCTAIKMGSAQALGVNGADVTVGA